MASYAYAGAAEPLATKSMATIISSSERGSTCDEEPKRLIAAGFPSSLTERTAATQSDEKPERCTYCVASNDVSAKALAACTVASSRQGRQFSAPTAVHPSQVTWSDGGAGQFSPGTVHEDSGALPLGTSNVSERLQVVSSPSPQRPPLRRRRSSWAAGAWPGLVPPGQSAGGLEDFSPNELYRQFVCIRDAVLKKVGSSGRPEQQPGGVGSDHHEDTMGRADARDSSGSVGSDDTDEERGAITFESSTRGPLIAEAEGKHGLQSKAAVCGPCSPAAAGLLQQPARYGMGLARPVATPSSSSSSQRPAACVGLVSAPQSPHRLSQASFAVEGCYQAAAGVGAPLSSSGCTSGYRQPDRPSTTGAGGGEAQALSPRVHVGGEGAPRLFVQVPSGRAEEGVERQEQSPCRGALIDLQQYFYSPTPSSCNGEEGQPHSPFEGAVRYASDCVAYNALYGGGAGAGLKPTTGVAGSAAGAVVQVPPLKCSSAGVDTQQHAEDARSGSKQLSVGSRAGRSGQMLLVALKPEICSSVPGTDSLFSLQPSGEPQSSFSQTGSSGEGSQQQQPQHVGAVAGEEPQRRGSCVRISAGAAQMMVWQEDMSESMASRAAPTAAGTSREGVVCASSGSANLTGGEIGEEAGHQTFRELQTSSSGLPQASGTQAGEETASEEHAGADSDVVIRRSGGQDEVCGRHSQGQNLDSRRASPDYMEAVKSVAHRTLLPLPCMPPAANAASGASSAKRTSSTAGIAGIRRGGAASFDTACVSAGGASYTSAVGGATAVSAVAAAYSSYVPLPLPIPRVPSSGAFGTGSAAGGIGSLPVLHACPSVAAATASVVRRCLDKGIPFAVMPAEHFAAVVAAAEQHDGPLAYHIMATQCTYYPGLGRPAASSGGGAFVGIGGVATPPKPATAGSAAAVAGGSGSGAGGSSSSGVGLLQLGAISAKHAGKAAAEAAAVVQQLLSDGKPLHVMSPCEYQRLLVGVQYGVRQLHDLLLAQPAVATAAAEAAATAAGLGSILKNNSCATGTGGSTAVPSGRVVPLSMPGGPVVRRHRRGSSIGSDCSFTATIARYQSGGEALDGSPSVAPHARGGRSLQSSSASPAVAAAAAATAGAVVSANVQQLRQLQEPEARLRALIAAAQTGNLCRVALLVEHGADVNATDSALGQPAPQHSSGSGATRSVWAGAFTAVASAAAGGRTPLHHAAEAGSFAVVQLLIHLGAFVGVRDGTGRTALELARRKGHLAVAQLLKDAAERRRDAVRSCTVEDRAAAAAAAAAQQPPPLPPKAKQLRCNSAPTGDAAVATAAAAAVALGQAVGACLPQIRLEAAAVATKGGGASVVAGDASAAGCSGAEGGAGETGRPEAAAEGHRSARSSGAGEAHELPAARSLTPPAVHSPRASPASAGHSSPRGTPPTAEGARTLCHGGMGPSSGPEAVGPTPGPHSRLASAPQPSSAANMTAALPPGVPPIRRKQQLSVVMESVEVPQQRRSRKPGGGLLACFTCGS